MFLHSFTRICFQRRDIYCALPALRYNRLMERVSHTLRRIVAAALHRLPPEELPAAAWEFAAGRAVAEKTRVLGCEKQLLLVEVPDANWRAQLYGMAPEFLSRLNQFLRIERIEFKLASQISSASTREHFDKLRSGSGTPAGAVPKGPAAPRKV